MNPARPLQAGTVQALLAGFRAIDLDAMAIHRAAACPDVEGLPFDAPLPSTLFGALWEAALAQRPDPALPTRVGLAVPFGAFSAVDYLAASAPRVGAAFGALATWFRQVSREFRVEVTASPAGGLVELIPTSPFMGREVSDEFTVAVMVGRFRAAAGRAVVPERVRLSRRGPAGGATVHAALLGCEVRFDCTVAAIEWGDAAWNAPLRTADAALQRTLETLAHRLELGPDVSPLVGALRARLRDLLPHGPASAEEAADALGVSCRTLQRRLQEEGTSFREVVDAFRQAEAERLLAAGHLPMGEVALQLGFSDQTAWNRAFRRWKGQSPTEWVTARRAR